MLAQRALYLFPPYIIAVIIIGFMVVLSIAGLFVVRRFIPHHKLKNHHDVADPLLGILGAMYSVLLAFVVVTVWQNYDKSNAGVQKEAIYMADLYRDSEALAPEFRQKLVAQLRLYRQALVDYEWKTMQVGQGSPQVEKIMRQIWDLYVRYTPKSQTELVFFNESVQKLNLFRELRRQRIMDSGNGIVPILWIVLIIGALSIISFTFLFGAENIKAQIVMGVLVSATIGLVLFTIVVLDFPFTGGVRITAEPFQKILLD